MKKLLNLIALSIVILSSTSAFAALPNAAAPQSPYNPVTTILEGDQGDDSVAQQGCCSWHQGVCGCQMGQVVCCDGSTSPSCHCLNDEEGKPVCQN